jgi:polyisoprenoid-binding protein YceI
VAVLPSGVWRADPVLSSVTFTVRHLLVSTFRAGFREIDAALDGDAATLSGSVPVQSIDITRPDFRERLLSSEFFDVDRHPRVEFTAATVHVGDDRTLTVPGELTIRGITHTVEGRGRLGIPGRGLGGTESVGLELSSTVDRREFGLTWQEDMPGGGLALAYDVTLEIVLELVSDA